VSTDPVIDDLQRRIREFARERDWEQFHTPKNLAMALSGEVGELVEILQWLTPEEAAAVMEGDRAADVEDELADILIYLLRLADVLDIDLLTAAGSKLVRNERRYPAPEVRGRADHKPA
jgi:dCTP diphosphatase